MSEQEKAKQATTNGASEKKKPMDREAAPQGKDKDVTDGSATDRKEETKKIKPGTDEW